MQPDLKWVLPIERMANQKPMDIVAHPNRFADRDAVYQNKRKLHLSSKVFMNEDYCKNTVEERKSQDEAFRDARSQEKFAYLSYKKPP